MVHGFKKGAQLKNVCPGMRPCDIYYMIEALDYNFENGQTGLDELLRANVDIHKPDNKGWTALHLACYYGNRKHAKLLVVNNADADLKTYDHDPVGKGPKTPLELAHATYGTRWNSCPMEALEQALMEGALEQDLARVVQAAAAARASAAAPAPAPAAPAPVSEYLRSSEYLNEISYSVDKLQKHLTEVLGVPKAEVLICLYHLSLSPNDPRFTIESPVYIACLYHPRIS